MLAKSILVSVASVIAFFSSTVSADAGDVFSAASIFQESITVAPFIVDRTTTITWTQSSSISESTEITPIPTTIQTVAAPDATA